MYPDELIRQRSTFRSVYFILLKLIPFSGLEAHLSAALCMLCRDDAASLGIEQLATAAEEPRAQHTAPSSSPTLTQ